MQDEFNGNPQGEGGTFVWTPRFYQAVEVSVQNRDSRFSVQGGWVNVYVSGVCKSAGTNGQYIYVSLPVPYPLVANVSNGDLAIHVGRGWYYDVGTTVRPADLMGITPAASTIPDRRTPWARLRSHSATAGASGDLGNDVVFAVASGDEFSFMASYPLGP